jgi:hypothetical protein
MDSAYCSPCSATRAGVSMERWRGMIAARRVELGWDSAPDKEKETP